MHTLEQMHLSSHFVPHMRHYQTWDSEADVRRMTNNDEWKNKVLQEQ